MCESAHPGRVTLRGSSAHHLARVCRAKVGDRVIIFDGEGSECDAVVTELGSDEVTVRTSVPHRGVTADKSCVTLIQGLPKGDKLDAIVRQCTELGVSAVWPVFTLRSVSRARELSPSGRTDRLNRIAEQAARQCGRADVPRVLDPTSLEQALERLDAGRAQGPRIVAWEGSTTAFSARIRAMAPGACTLLIGPEGGLSEPEVDKCRSHGFLDVSLGPRVLRAETAPVAALAMLSLLRGDLAEW